MLHLYYLAAENIQSIFFKHSWQQIHNNVIFFQKKLCYQCQRDQPLKNDKFCKLQLLDTHNSQMLARMDIIVT
jgi:hypothetical protein